MSTRYNSCFEAKGQNTLTACFFSKNVSLITNLWDRIPTEKIFDQKEIILCRRNAIKKY